jgi:hypothetical protein
MGLLASARQQIVQGWQGNPSFQAVNMKKLLPAGIAALFLATGAAH